MFTELRSVTRVGGRSGLVGIGSKEQPFSLFIPDIDSPEGQEMVNFLETRYISGAEDRPKRSYAYVTGELSTFRDRPQMVLTTVSQITDSIIARKDTSFPAAVTIASLLPDPIGADAGFERVTLQNMGSGAVNMHGWTLQDRGGNRLVLDGVIEAGQAMKISPPVGQMPLNNTGDEIVLLDPDGKIQNKVSYSASDVIAGQPIQFA